MAPKFSKLRPPGAREERRTRTAVAVCAFLHCDPHYCLTCKIHTQELDRDYLPEVECYLQWPKVHTDKDGVIHPNGNECGQCFGVRRRYFTMTQKALLAQIEQNPALGQKVADYRKDRCKGTKLFVLDTKDSALALVDSGETTFNQGFVSGEFFELRNFARKKKNLNLALPDEELCKQITERFGFTTGLGRTNELGVFVTTLSEGASYAFKVGANTFATQRNQEQFEDRDAATERFKELEEEMGIDAGEGAEVSAPATTPASGSEFPITSKILADGLLKRLQGAGSSSGCARREAGHGAMEPRSSTLSMTNLHRLGHGGTMSPRGHDGSDAEDNMSLGASASGSHQVELKPSPTKSERSCRSDGGS